MTDIACARGKRNRALTSAVYTPDLNKAINYATVPSNIELLEEIDRAERETNWAGSRKIVSTCENDTSLYLQQHWHNARPPTLQFTSTTTQPQPSMSATTPPTHLLLTGATGHIGFATLLYALRHTSYPIRLAVRSIPSAKSLILSNPSISALNLPTNRLTFTSVPDITAHGAYTEALQDITHVIHIASPIPSAHLSASPEEAEEIFIRPAVNGTLGLLESCRSVPSIKHVVLLSSVVATMPAEHFACIAPAPPGVVFTATSRTQPPPAPYPTLQAAYCASKVQALNAAEEWVGDVKPEWSVSAVMPGWVIGRDESKVDVQGVKSGTNMLMLGVCLGTRAEGRKAGGAVHVADVARVCVCAAFEEGKGVEMERGKIRSFLAARPIVWQDAVTVVKTEFAKEVEQGLLSEDGYQETMEIPFDASETEKEFGFEFLPWEEMVRGVLRHYVEVSRQRK